MVAAVAAVAAIALFFGKLVLLVRMLTIFTKYYCGFNLERFAMSRSCIYTTIKDGGYHHLVENINCCHPFRIDHS